MKLEEGFVKSVFEKFVRCTNLNPLLIYEMTIPELLCIFEETESKTKEDIEVQANTIRIAVASAMNGKPMKLFEKDHAKPKATKSTKKKREEEMEAIKDL